MFAAQIWILDHYSCCVLNVQLLHLFYLWDLANYNHHLDDTMICSTGNNLNQNKTCFTFLLQSIFSAILFHYSSNGLWKMDCSLRTSWRNEQKLIHNCFSTHAHLRYFVSSWDWSWLQSLPKNLILIIFFKQRKDGNQFTF